MTDVKSFRGSAEALRDAALTLVLASRELANRRFNDTPVTPDHEVHAAERALREAQGLLNTVLGMTQHELSARRMEELCAPTSLAPEESSYD